MGRLLEVRDLGVVYATRQGPLAAVSQVSFTLDKGRSLGLVGESGSGKSSIGAAIVGLLPDSAIATGQIRFNGIDLLTADAQTLQQIRWKRIAMIFQAAMNALNPIQRVGDQILEAIRMHEPDFDPNAAAVRVNALFDLVGLPRRRRNDYPHQYSGGMRQRAVIAMALACRPEMIIADEPTSAMDVIVQAQVLATLGKLQRTHGTGILFISHDISVVAEVCHDIAVLYGGHIVEIGTCREVLETPVHPYTRSLLAAHIPLGRIRTAQAAIIGPPPDPASRQPCCCFQARCERADNGCNRQSPHWHRISDTHRVLCRHSAKIAVEF
ncbi:MAG: ABC transporter ATP-binding protein [Desulfatitalea sp.]|nr:ABC transporter ATP-binding protein [Desulfatitalea sp.]NNK01087.1 ABC transporter ATP-binding protein [Desulfatitalea sp.]